MAINHYDQYLENQLTTATPGRLVVMTFDAAIRFARTASEKMREHNLYEQSTNIRKVQNILLELISSLNMKADPALGNDLYSLYTYLFDRLTQANIKDDEAALVEVTEMLCRLRETWAEAELIVRSGGRAQIPEEAMAAA